MKQHVPLGVVLRLENLPPVKTGGPIEAWTWMGWWRGASTLPPVKTGGPIEAVCARCAQPFAFGPSRKGTRNARSAGALEILASLAPSCPLRFLSLTPLASNVRVAA